MDYNPNTGSGPVLAGSDAVLRQYLRSVFAYMSGGLILTGVIAYAMAASGLVLALVSDPILYLVALLTPLGLVWFLSARINTMSVFAVQASYWIYAALLGVTLSTIFLRYTGESITSVFFITAGMFGAMSVYGYVTKADLSGWGSFLFMGLIGLIIASIVNLFVQSSMLYFVVSVVGVIVFTGLTAYDMNKIKQIAAASASYDDTARKGAILGALNLYLDFVNLFLSLLRLMGSRR